MVFLVQVNVIADAPDTLSRRAIWKEHDNNIRDETTEEVLEQVNYFVNNKLLVNEASPDQIRALPLIDPTDAQKLILFKRKRKVITKNDFFILLGEEKAHELLPMISFDLSEKKQPKFIELLEYGKLLESLQIQWVNRTSYNDPYELPSGSPYSFYSRFQTRLSENFFLSALIEKDIGETSFVDFYSIGFEIRNLYNLKSLVVGDYNLRFANGLVSRTAGLFFKSIEYLPIVRRSGKELQIYTSSNESNFFRGAAAEVEIGLLKMIGFYSNVNRDATLVNDNVFSSINETGVHVSENELSKKQNLNEESYGGRIVLGSSFGWISFDAGVSLLKTVYSKTYEKRNSFNNNVYFLDNNITNASFDLNIWLYNVNIYSEIALLLEIGALATISGIIAQINDDIKFEISLRYYEPNYFSPRANVFGEGLGETGFFSSIFMRLSSWILVQSYIDIFWDNQLKNTAFSEALGLDFQVKSVLKINKLLNFVFYFHTKSKEKNHDVITPFGARFESLKENGYSRVRSELYYKLASSFRLKTRAEIKFAYEADKNFFGWLFYQELKIKLLQNTLSLLGRIAVFQTDDFASAIYVYQQRIPLVSRISSRHGSGYSFLVNLKANLVDYIELSASYSFLSKNSEGILPENSHSFWGGIKINLRF